MKKTLLFFLVLCFLFSLSASSEEISLFDINSELESYKREEMEEGDEEKYGKLEFYLLTGGPGSLVWENFGHSAILMTSPSFSAVAYDWGIFTFNESFFKNFAFGRLYYEAWATRGDYRVFSLESDDRDVSAVKLELDTNEKKNLYSFLQYSTKKENRTYLYDYFLDNCATRPRDIYSWLTEGDFEEWLKNKEAEETIRDTVERHLSLSTFPVAWTISYLLGPEVDGNATMWDACFLPSILEEMIVEYQGSERIEYYSSQNRKAVPEKWNMEIRALVMGIIVALIPLLSRTGKRSLERCGDVAMGLLYLFFGLLSSVLIFLAFFTIHHVARGNLNALIISPLCLLSSVLHFMSLGKRRRVKGIRINAAIMLAFAIFALLLRLLVPSLIQDSAAVFIPALLLYTSELLLEKRR